ncbi:MAG: phenylacetate-CoA oxygenase subunit PaaC [Actinomycetota bacterium]|nr:phenylacetate-CoA oxygenase subunit PaaC [Actinomycetota bacterium]
MGFDNAYESLLDVDDDLRWAFGTGFADPLAGVDASVPDGIDGDQLAAYCLMLGDDALVMSHRLQEWLTQAPELEEETALANVGLDLLGQARLLYTRAGKADGTDRGEDHYAYWRGVEQFSNVRLVEPLDADFGALVVRLLLFSTWRLALLSVLRDSRDPVLAALAARSVSEVSYHRDYAAQWVVRLADGTEYSRQRVQAGLEGVAPFTAELFEATQLERELAGAGIGVDPCTVQAEVDAVLTQVLGAGGLGWIPCVASAPRLPGHGAGHTPALAGLLEEMQSVARAHPGATW